MAGVDQRTLRAAADAYVMAICEYKAATAEAHAACDRLQASPETIEYQIDWNVARREEAAAHRRMNQANETHRRAGGYVVDGDD